MVGTTLANGCRNDQFRLMFGSTLVNGWSNVGTTYAVDVSPMQCSVLVQRLTSDEHSNVAQTICAAAAPTVGTWLADCRSTSWVAVATLINCLDLNVFVLSER